MNPHPSVLVRGAPYQATLDFLGAAVDETVNFGTNLFGWLLTDVPANHERLTLALFLRHELELLDGISALLKTGSDEPIRLLLRSAFEAHLGVLYVSEADSERRALCYRVANIHRLLTLAKRMDPSTDEGKQAQKAIESDTSGFLIRPEGHPTAKWVTGLTDRLQLPAFVPIEQEWQRTKKANRRKRPNWFSLFGGPMSIQELAVRMGHGSWYEKLYTDWSGGVHASDLLEQTTTDAAGNLRIMGLRNPKDLQLLTTLGISMAILSMRRIGEKFVANGAERLRDWYNIEFREQYWLPVSGTPMIEVKEESESEDETAQGMAQDDPSTTKPPEP